MASILIDLSSNEATLEISRKFFEYIKDRNISLNPRMIQSRLKSEVLYGDMETAEECFKEFDKVKSPIGPFSWNLLLSGFRNHDDPEKVKEYYQKFLDYSITKPDSFTYLFVFSAYLNHHQKYRKEIEELIDEMSKPSFKTFIGQMVVNLQRCQKLGFDVPDALIDKASHSSQRK
ncbi:uncharacterized protein ASCRUDRAFT_74607 [Ascoidea rubescens DSM 1968]|uniref:Uncharacterized protein n=1 Tax=Ascoidea rubescens DSM 1968 TaxID=1344418 RepID=A0A1D2VKP7_9ASCO|nr:hypothetical protein ASCRUDRAFT_74607 [Ascoidea rubescens DSM 1968]ODV62165.1 hypothetical protein ASCRUDRAFT_74607 [Ascoidea rubescens DSM 1968]